MKPSAFKHHMLQRLALIMAYGTQSVQSAAVLEQTSDHRSFVYLKIERNFIISTSMVEGAHLGQQPTH